MCGLCQLVSFGGHRLQPCLQLCSLLLEVPFCVLVLGLAFVQLLADVRSFAQGVVGFTPQGFQVPFECCLLLFERGLDLFHVHARRHWRLHGRFSVLLRPTPVSDAPTPARFARLRVRSGGHDAAAAPARVRPPPLAASLGPFATGQLPGGAFRPSFRRVLASFLRLPRRVALHHDARGHVGRRQTRPWSSSRAPEAPLPSEEVLRAGHRRLAPRFPARRVALPPPAAPGRGPSRPRARPERPLEGRIAQPEPPGLRASASSAASRPWRGVGALPRCAACAPAGAPNPALRPFAAPAGPPASGSAAPASPWRTSVRQDTSCDDPRAHEHVRKRGRRRLGVVHERSQCA
eukprot:scaffold64_cov338-Pavlova_lutheri.AAC.66